MFEILDLEEFCRDETILGLEALLLFVVGEVLLNSEGYFHFLSVQLWLNVVIQQLENDTIHDFLGLKLAENNKVTNLLRIVNFEIYIFILTIIVIIIIVIGNSHVDLVVVVMWLLNDSVKSLLN